MTQALAFMWDFSCELSLEWKKKKQKRVLEPRFTAESKRQYVPLDQVFLYLWFAVHVVNNNGKKKYNFTPVSST